MRKSKVKTLIGVIITLCIMFVGTVGGAIYLKQQLDLNKTAYDEVSAELQSNQRTVYVTIVNEEAGEIALKAGTVLEENVNVEKRMVYSSLPESSFITEDDLGKPLINTVPGGTPVLNFMVAHDEVDIDDREYEVRVANIMTSQTENDLIDIRILFPNGKDYAIATKKRVENLSLENASFTCLLNEEEILRMASATIDAYTMSGAYIYTTRYVEEVNYAETIPTYPVREETIALMQEDPNLLSIAENTVSSTVRKNLERSLASLNKEHVTAVTSGWNLDDNANSQIIIENSRSMDDEETTIDSVVYNWNFETEETATDVTEDTVTE